MTGMAREMSQSAVPCWLPVVMGAAAGGMGWGIRGQYGHETGAMMAGLLVALALCAVFVPAARSLPVIRAIAWCAIGMGIGGSMTYGQTIGLTQNPGMVGNPDALTWGMTGLAIKGAIWIGFGGTFLGMGLGGFQYSLREMLLVYLGMLALCALGIWLLNEPFEPSNRALPRIYFSAGWRWSPEATVEQLKPRREVWGGLLLALGALLAWVRFFRGDRLAFRLGLWGCLGGAIGFPLGQSLQAFHAWNRSLFATGEWARADRLINWWNFMETTFGAVMGASLGLGLWLSRDWILRGTLVAGENNADGRRAGGKIGEKIGDRPRGASPASQPTEASGGDPGETAALPLGGEGAAGDRPQIQDRERDPATPHSMARWVSHVSNRLETLTWAVEWTLLVVHVVLLIGVEFAGIRWIDRVYDFGLLLAMIPILALTRGRLWPWATVLVVILIPIAGKTFRSLVLEQATVPYWVGICAFLALPLAASLGMARWIQCRELAWMEDPSTTGPDRGLSPNGNAAFPSLKANDKASRGQNPLASNPLSRAESPPQAGRWLVRLLVFQVLMYFGLNHAFFRFPWPWQEWTARTPNSLVFSACVAVLVVGAWHVRRPKPDS